MLGSANSIARNVVQVNSAMKTRDGLRMDESYLELTKTHIKRKYGHESMPSFEVTKFTTSFRNSFGLE